MRLGCRKSKTELAALLAARRPKRILPPMGHPTSVLSALRKAGLLLKQDKSLPNVVTAITGESLAASWWSHPRAADIYAALEQLSERSDVIETKLIAGKVTFVLAPLWPALLGVATCREPWQLAGLSAPARRLLASVERAGEVAASGALVKELEGRLAVRSEQRHTPSGKHVLMLESWSSWAARLGVKASSVAKGKAALERAASALGAPLSVLPWSTGRSRGRSVKR